MLKIMLFGCCGKMGRVISDLVFAREDMEIVCGIDVNICNTDFPVYANPNDFGGKADVIIDFSHPNVLSSILDYAKKTGTPSVICTTGLSKSQIDSIEEYAKYVPIFFSFNMSLGINLLIELVKKSAALLGDGFDVEVIEKHHNQKIDAPSGTAIMIADELSKSLPYNSSFVYDRHSTRKKRDKNEIGIHAVRGGTIVGEHEVIFAGKDEIVSISHSAMSKEIFAVGAIKAAAFLKDKKPSLYNMKDLIGN